MSNKLKSNIPLIIVIIVLALSGFFGLKSYKKHDDYLWKMHTENYEKCQSGESGFILCDDYTEPPIKRDTINTFGDAFCNQDELGNLEIFAPFLIIFASIFGFHKKIRKGFLKNNLTRIGYMKFLKREYLKTIKKYCLVYPIFLLILFFMCYLISGNFEYEKSVSLYHNNYFGVENTRYWYIFLPSFLLNFVFNSIFWINIGIYNCKNNNKALLAVIISYIEYIMIFVIFEFALANGIFAGTDLGDLFALASVYAFTDIPLLEVNLFTGSLAIISTLIVYLSYRNKEKVLIEVGI